MFPVAPLALSRAFSLDGRDTVCAAYHISIL